MVFQVCFVIMLGHETHESVPCGIGMSWQGCTTDVLMSSSKGSVEASMLFQGAGVTASALSCVM
jgi:hypothetical protein